MPDHSSSSGIVVGVDGSPESEAAIRWATAEAMLRDQPVTLAHAIAPVQVTWPVAYLEASYLDSQEAAAHEIVESAQKIVHEVAGVAKPPEIRTCVWHANAGTALVAASRNAQMTVVGSRGLGAVGRAVLGSVSGGLVHHGHGPIAVIRRTGTLSADHASPVLLGVDGSAASEEAIAMAFDEASRRGVDLVALHAWSDVVLYFPLLGVDWSRHESEGQELLAQRLAGWQERYPDVRVHRRVVCDQPARWLVEESEKAQVVIVGSHGRGGFSGMLLGSVSAKLVQGTTTPVIVVRPR